MYQDSASRAKHLIMELEQILFNRVHRQEEEWDMDQRIAGCSWSSSAFLNPLTLRPTTSILYRGIDDYLTATFQSDAAPFLTNFYLKPCREGDSGKCHS